MNPKTRLSNVQNVLVDHDYWKFDSFFVHSLGYSLKCLCKTVLKSLPSVLASLSSLIQCIDKNLFLENLKKL